MQRILFTFAGALLGLLLLAAPARAYTPESGVWWSPSEPGTGLLIEIQDNYVALFAYVYDNAGNATWYTSNGFLTGNARYVGVLDRFTGGQAIGGNWRPNTAFLGAGGPVRIDFNPVDATRATLTWGGRTKPIERFQFYLKRPEDQQAFPNVRVELTKMLGEWQAVLDYSDHPTVSVQYYGEIVILDRLASDAGGRFVDGCRAADSQIGFCRAVDINEHLAVVEYVPSTDEHVLVVENSATTFAAYFLEVGTNDFRGEVSVYPRGGNPSVYYPVRGFRSASRSFVQEGVGPSKRAEAEARKARQVLPLTEASAKASVKALQPEREQALRALEARLEAGASRER
jgi:hypothetical protein